MKYKILILPLYLWLHTQKQMENLAIFTKRKKTFPHFWRLKNFKIISFSNFLISLFGEISPVKKKKKAVEEFVQENTSPYLPRQCFPITTGLHPLAAPDFARSS
jgi:hypothetical protein